MKIDLLMEWMRTDSGTHWRWVKFDQDGVYGYLGIAWHNQRSFLDHEKWGVREKQDPEKWGRWSCVWVLKLIESILRILTRIRASSRRVVELLLDFEMMLLSPPQIRWSGHSKMQWRTVECEDDWEGLSPSGLRCSE